MSWFLFLLAALATFRLAHLVSKERGPLAIFERIRKGMPGGRGSPKEWLSCIFCFSLTSSAVVCGILWTTGLKFDWQEWLLSWLGFSAITLIINQAFRFDKWKIRELEVLRVADFIWVPMKIQLPERRLLGFLVCFSIKRFAVAGPLRPFGLNFFPRTSL